MCRKTLIREVYGQKHIPLDPRRIDLEYRKHRQQELSIKVAENDVQKEKDITETTDMDYMVESTSQLEQEENKNESKMKKGVIDNGKGKQWIWNKGNSWRKDEGLRNMVH